MKKELLLILSILLISAFAFAQSPEDQARAELERRGLGDAEVRARLLEKGVNVDAIDINNPSEIFKLEKTLKEVIDELEKEKLSKNNSLNTETSLDTLKNRSEEEAKILAKEGENIAKAVDDGATLEEAISEELIDAQESELPKAKMYGQEVFRSQNIKLYRKSQDVKPPASYILGVGDIIAISIWGYSEEDLIFEINKEGYIKPQGIPRIYLKGIRLGNAKNLLLSRFSNYYRFNKNEFEVALNFGRTININITGEVYNFGSFNLPAINTAFNALVAAGGPNDIGSVRNILLKRFGQEDVNIDIYKYLNDPSYSMDFYLEEEDIIHVPVAQKIIKISGAVIRPNRYELKKNEDLVELLQFCGGLKSNASLKNIQVKRFENNVEKIVDINLNDVIKSNTDFKLKNGDEILVPEIPDTYKNFATLEGAVGIPGKYAITPNSKITDLINKTYLEDHAFLDVAYLKRKNKDNTTFSFIRIPVGEILSNPSSINNVFLENGDELVIYSKSKFKDVESFSVMGNVREPGEFSYDFSKSMKLNDAILMSGGLKKQSTDFAYIHRVTGADNTQISYIRVNIKSAINNPTGKENIEIKPGDKIVTYSKNLFSEQFTITIKGFVKQPGEFKYDPNLKIADLITMSGGLTFNASRKRIDLYRLELEEDKNTKTLAANLEIDKNNNVISGDFNLKPFDIIVIRPAPDFENIKTVTIKGEVRYPGTYAIISDNESIASIIDRAGGTTGEAFLSGSKVYRVQNGIGYIAVDLQLAYDDKKSEQNIILKEFDEIYIPKKESLVTIQGFVKSDEALIQDLVDQGRIVVPFIKGKSADYYINNFAGGIQEIGDKNNITVTYPSGILKRSKKFLFWTRYPEVLEGSKIFVHDKEIKKEEENKKSNIDWGNILTNSIAQATSVLTLILLIQRID